MTNLPETAIAAAKDAFARVYNDPATMTACVGAAIEAAAPLIAAAERERIAVLAEKHDAFVPVTREDTYGAEYQGSEPFADLIREQDGPDAEA